MKKNIALISILAFLKLIIQLVGNANYGFHRDELLHLSVSEHLDWGFMEFPPFISWLGKLSYLFFDYSLMGTRLFPTLAGVGILILCCLMAKEFKGNKYAILIAGVSVLAFLPFYRNHTLFQPVAFDQFFWTLAFYYLIRFIHTENKKYLLCIGLTLGLGLMNKYTMLMWAFGVFVGMIFHKKGKFFKNTYCYLSGLLALLIVSPNIIWQFQNNLPLLRHLQALAEVQSEASSPFAFGLKQLDFPLTLIVSIFGLVFLFSKSQYRALGIAAILIFINMWLLQAKAYYVFALYPLLFAAGATKIADLLKNKRPFWNYGLASLLFLSALPLIPYLTPVLPIENFVQYADLKEENGRIELTGDYADMFGWEEQVKLVDSVYRSLSIEEQAKTVLWAENYGEAGALKILGKQYGLPKPISRHGSFWQWGHGKEDAEIWISLGNETPSVEYVFEETELVKIIRHTYAIGEENGIPLYICRKPKLDIPQWWKDYEPYIFD